MSYEVVETEIRTQKIIRLKHIRLQPNLYAIKQEVTYQRDGEASPFEVRSVQCLVDEGNRCRAVSEQNFTPDRSHVVLDSSGKSSLVRYICQPTQKNEAVFLASTPENVFDALVQGDLTADDVFHVNSVNKSVKSITKKMFPMPMRFSHEWKGNVSDLTYDLFKLAAHLLPRQDIVFASNRRIDQTDYFTPAETVAQTLLVPEGQIMDPHMSQTVSFVWTPTPEEYARLWDAAKAITPYDPEFSLARAIFELDALGLRACGAALFDNFYESRQPVEGERGFAA